MIALLVSLALAAGPLSMPGAHVTVPWNDFERLYQAYAKDVKPPAAPRDWTLDRAVYAGSLVGSGDDAFALVKVQFRGQVHAAQGWVTVPLLGATAALRSARMDGKDAPIFVRDGYYTLVTDRRGAFSIDLEFAVKTFAADGETGFTFPLGQAGATVVGFSVDSDDAIKFSVPGAQGVTQLADGKARRVEALVPSLGSLTVSWARDALTAEEARTPRVYAEARTLVGVGEGVLQCNAQVDFTVLHAPVRAFTVAVPRDVTILDVRGAGLRDWKQGDDGTIQVELNYDALGLYRLSMDYERVGLGGGEIPLVEPRGVARATTFVGVDARSALEIVAGTPRNAVAVDVRELPAALVGLTDYPVLLGFRSRTGDVGIPLQVKQHPGIDMLLTLVDAAQAETLVTADGRRMTRVRYAVRNNRRQFLRLQLPEGAEVWSATVAGRSVKVARGEAGVLVPLVRSEAGGGALAAYAVELVYVEGGSALARGRGEIRTELPTVDAPTSMLQWTVYVPASAKVLPGTSEGSVRRVPYYSALPQVPAGAMVAVNVADALHGEVQQQAQAGALGAGAEPVDVTLPLGGTAVMFEKTLVLDEQLWIGFDYRNREKAL